MNKRTGLSFKIGFGFATLIALMLLLGVLAVIELRDVRTSAQDLTEESVPTVVAANNIERHSLLAMYADQRFQFTGDVHQAGMTLTNLDQAHVAAGETASVATQHGLSNIGDFARKADGLILSYQDVMRRAIVQMETMRDLRRQLEQSEDRYHKSCQNIYTAEARYAVEYVSAHLTAKSNVAAGAESPIEVVRDHFRENALYRDLIDEGHEVMIAMQEAHSVTTVPHASAFNFGIIRFHAEGAGRCRCCRMPAASWRGSAASSRLSTWNQRKAMLPPGSHGRCLKSESKARRRSR